MLLLEEQQDNSYVAYYDSSNILMSKYVPTTKKLAIIFAKGHQYLYEDVIPYHYQRFKIAQSQGKSLKEHIINNYVGSKTPLNLSSEQIEQIKEQIQQIKEQRLL